MASWVVGKGSGSHGKIARYGPVLLVAVFMVASFGAASTVSGATSHPAVGSAGPAPASAAPSSAPTVPLSGTPTHATASGFPSAPTALTPPSTSGVHLGNFKIPGPHPAAWGPSGIPPGAQGALNAIHPPSSGAVGTPKSNNWSGSLCQGIYPGGPNGQQYYVGDCYGHDEPSIMFYSTLPGSGGNVSWNVTLPTDRSPTQNQTDLYVAIWFGMALYDPHGLWHQCFLELQFYPDQTWYNPGPMFPSLTVNGAWIGEAVAWEINATTGFEDPCFVEPLFLNGVPGPAFLNMTQGDQIGVQMKGWAGSTIGEQIFINDTTNGQKSNVVMYNRGQAAPLDPVYSTVSSQDNLEWGLGGQYPVSFSYETGHTWSPSINSNQYGGCNPGLPGSSIPTPCGTFDPGSWANDTLTPWLIHPPVFTNAAQHQVGGAQVAFEQDFGGIAQVDGLSGLGSCYGNDGASWCSYPWYSYSCGAGAFEFGATDYPGVSADFGKYTQFHYRYQNSPQGIGYSIPTNFTTPTCGGPSANLTVATTGGAGTVNFLSHWWGSGSTVDGLALGSYSINAVAPAGQFFGSWSSSGGVAVADANTSWTSVTISGDGTLTANFVGAPVTATVTFDDVGGAGNISVTTYNFSFAPLLSIGPNGHTATLAAGIYTIQAYPPVGYNFTYWTVAGATITAPGSTVSNGYPITNLIVSGGVAATVTAHYVASPSLCPITIASFGPGTMTLAALTATGGYYLPGGYSTVNTSFGLLPVGGYTLTLSAPAGWFYYGLGYGFPGVDLTDWVGEGTSSVSIPLALENGSSAYTFIEVFFTEKITFNDNPAAGGMVLGPTGAELSSGTSISSPGPYPFPGYIVAQPATGYVFSDWTNSTALLPFSNNTNINTRFLTGASGTITANYVAASGSTSLAFTVVDPAGGTLTFNGAPVTNGTTNSSVATGGVYFASVTVNAGYTFVGFSGSGGTTAAPAPWNPGIEVTTSSAGTLTATFAPAHVGISYVASSAVTVTAQVNGATMTNDLRQLLVPGTVYPLSITAAGYGFEMWTASPSITIANPTAKTTTFSFTGAGTIYALVIPLPSGVTAAPNPTEVGVSTTLSATYAVPGPHVYSWSALPPGCTSSNSLALTCTPTTSGTYSPVISLTQDGFTFPSAPGSVVVDGPLSATVSVDKSTIDVGQTATLTGALTAGIAPDSESWTGLPGGCTSSNVLVLTCTPTASGSFTVDFTGTDTVGASASSTVTLTVNPAVTAALQLSAATITQGGAITFTVTAGGGSGTYTYAYAGLPTGCAGTGPTLTCNPSVSGTFTVTVTVTDSLGGSATATKALTVNAPTSSGGTFLGLPASEGYALLAGIIVLVVALIVAAALVSRRRKQQPPMESTPYAGSPPSGGGSS